MKKPARPSPRHCATNTIAQRIVATHHDFGFLPNSAPVLRLARTAHPSPGVPLSLRIVRLTLEAAIVANCVSDARPAHAQDFPGRLGGNLDGDADRLLPGEQPAAPESQLCAVEDG